MKRKFLSTIVCLTIILIAVLLLPNKASAAATVASGTCGSNLRWSLDDTGTLTISGTGAMVNYTSASNVPWYTYRKSISSIIISDGITSIGDSAFEQCSSRSITIPKSVTSIGAWAFSESSLQSITIPDGVTSIGMHAFERCLYLKSITIPNGVTKISNCAFYKSGIQSITIPNSVTSIGVFAFSESFLTSIIIPNSVTNIDGTAFFNCRSLRKVTYCGTEEQWRQLNLGSINAPLTAATRIYHNWNISSCTELKSCTICGESTIGHAWLGATCDKPETCSLCGVTEGDICHNVHFGICENCQQYGTCGENLIWTLNAVGTLTILGTGEMTDYGGIDEVEDCIESPWQAVATDIKAVVIEKGVTTIGCEAFYKLSNLTSVTIGDSVTSIGSDAFYDCANLTSITIGNSVSSIGDSAFNGCSSLTSIDIPDSVTRIGSGAFGSCRSLQSITIPNSITSISYGTFQGCSDLTIITIPDSVTYIGDNAFGLCSGLTAVTIPDSVTSIGHFAFRGCSSLTAITIPDSVTSIGNYAFSDCSSLTAITIPDSVTSIGSYAFIRCSSLTHVAYTGTQTQWNSISIGSSNTNLTSTTRHYETRFQNVANCVETGVYCPVCKDYLIRTNTGSGHNYSDMVITKPATLTSAGQREQTCTTCGDTVIEPIDMLVGNVYQWNITVEDDYAVNFLLQVSESIQSTAKVRLTIGTDIVTYNISDLVKTEDGYFVLTANISAAQMNDFITVMVWNGREIGCNSTYTAREYCDEILANPEHSAYHDLVREMLNYGAMAQIYFDYDTEYLANEGITGVAIEEVPETAEEMTISGKISGLNFYGAGLVFRDRIAVRYYFTGDIAGCTFTANGNTYTPVAKDEMCYVEISDILPQNLDQQITLVVADTAGDTLSVSYSPMNYIVRMNVKGNENLQNLLKALYNYHLAAKQLSELSA